MSNILSRSIKALRTKTQFVSGFSSKKKMTNMPNQSAILRYASGDERFQLKIVHNNRVYNFDRSASDPVQVILDRIVTNISKKQKKPWDEVADILLNSDVIPDKTILASELLKDVLKDVNKLTIKISEDFYQVSVNPPEIHSIKFLKQVVAGLPIIPHKIETSTNFVRDASKYRWEFSRDESPKGIVQKKNAQKTINNPHDKTQWEGTGSDGFIFTPSDDSVGARLRFTCYPSDNRCFGSPFSQELPELVSPFPVKIPLYLERLSRMGTQTEKDDPNFLRVVTYNCLAECYATEEWFIASPKTSLPADFRLPFLCKELSGYGADVYCLQEIDEKHFERVFCPYFEITMGYQGYFSAKTGDVQEGVAVFFNPRKLKPIKTQTVVISEHMKTMPIWGKLPSTVSERVQERNSVLQVSIFEPRQQPKTIVIIANTHLYFHPDADHIRLLQTITCVDYIETVSNEIKKNFDGFRVAVLFCGDFNCTPPFSSFRYLTSGKIEANDEDFTSHPTEKLEPGFSLTHSLQLSNSHPDHELTNITTCFEGCLDYILYQDQHFKLLNIYPPPSKDMLTLLFELSEPRQVSLPNLYQPSDHLPLISDFMLKS